MEDEILTEPWDISRIDGTTTVFPEIQPLVHDMGFRLLSNLFKDSFSLLRNDLLCLEIIDVLKHRALHDGSAFVIFDISRPYGTIQRNLFREALLPEITDCVVVRIREEMHHCRIGGLYMGFEVVHQHTTIALGFDL